MQLKDSLVSAALVCMEALWLFSVLILVGFVSGMANPPLNFVLCLLLLVCSFYSSKVLSQLEATKIALQGAGLAIAVIVIFFALGIQLAPEGSLMDSTWLTQFGAGPNGLRATFLGLLSGLILWRRGIGLAQKENDRDSLALSFKIGLAVMAILVILDAASPRDISPIVILFPFFGTGLIGLALANVQTEREDGKQGLSLSQWNRVLLTMVIGMLIASALVSLVANNQVANLVSWLFGYIGLVAELVFTIIFLAFGYVAEFLINGIFAILKMLGAGTNTYTPATERGDLLSQIREKNQDAKQFPPLVLNLLKWGFFSICTTGVLFWLARALRLNRKDGLDNSSDERDSVWEENSVVNDLAGLLSHLWKGIPVIRRTPLLDLSTTDGVTLTQNIYLNLVSIAKRRGLLRGDSQTPFEFQVVLAAKFPSDAVRRVSESFVRVRYGGQTPNEEEIKQLRADWDLIRTPETPQ